MYMSRCHMSTLFGAPAVAAGYHRPLLARGRTVGQRGQDDAQRGA